MRAPHATTREGQESALIFIKRYPLARALPVMRPLGAQLGHDARPMAHDYSQRIWFLVTL
ncbi:hypothetical protein [Acetobacter orientalis]|uniref:hypothetical protein n=1 Tax=Acetobacter orientalis TaxID=146474 RepID=UPI0039EB777E